jgi:hypothetical protein
MCLFDNLCSDEKCGVVQHPLTNTSDMRIGWRGSVTTYCSILKTWVLIEERDN